MGHSPAPGRPEARLDRRAALKRGALVGGALVWAAPVVQAVSLTAAHAESPSAPPQGPPSGPPNQPPSTPPTATRPPVPPPGSPPATPPGSPPASPSPQAKGQLAFTGTGLPVVPTVAVAASLIATGAAAQAVGRRRDPDLDDVEDELA